MGPTSAHSTHFRVASFFFLIWLAENLPSVLDILHTLQVKVRGGAGTARGAGGGVGGLVGGGGRGVRNNLKGKIIDKGTPSIARATLYRFF